MPPKKPRTRGPRTGENTCRQLKPKEEWIAIPVPPIVTQEAYDLAAAQRARNAALSFRHNTKYNYLLRCLLTCRSCGLAMFGRAYLATRKQPARCYYTCHGKDCILSGRERACPRRAVKAAELEAAVWDHVKGLLGDPDRLLAQFQNCAELSAEGSAQEQAEAERLEAAVRRVGREEKRLLDAYQAEVIELDELTARRQRLGERRRALLAQQGEYLKLRQGGSHARQVLGELSAFCERVRTRLEAATFAEKQAILQLLIERIIVGEETLEIRHVIPLHDVPEEKSEPAGSDRRLRSDGALLSQRF